MPTWPFSANFLFTLYYHLIPQATRDSLLRTAFLPFSPPLIGEEEIAEVVDALRSDWITTRPGVCQCLATHRAGGAEASSVPKT